jgi:hypothetical protein
MTFLFFRIFFEHDLIFDCLGQTTECKYLDVTTQCFSESFSKFSSASSVKTRSQPATPQSQPTKTQQQLQPT